MATRIARRTAVLRVGRQSTQAEAASPRVAPSWLWREWPSLRRSASWRRLVFTLAATSSLSRRNDCLEGTPLRSGRRRSGRCWQRRRWT